MPNRILRDTLLTSRKLAAVSPEAEALYYRLMVSADDFGRFHADPAIVKGRCCPLRDVNVKHVAGLLKSLADAGLILIYQADGEAYLVFTKWQQKPRAAESKFPEPPADASICSQVRADASLDVFVFEDVSEDVVVVRDDVSSLCEHLARRVEENTGRPPSVGKGWHDAARLILDADKRPPDEATRLIDWCQADEFWRSVIHSMPKFRAKYDTLLLQSRRSNGKGSATYADTRAHLVAMNGGDAK